MSGIGSSELIVIILSVVVPLVLGLAVTVAVLFFVFKLIKGLGNASAANTKILQEGRAAQAKITQLGPTGMRVAVMGQHSVQMTLMLEVSLPGIPPYVVQTQPMVPEIAMARMQPGVTIPVKVHPTDNNTVAIDFAAMGYMV